MIWTTTPWTIPGNRAIAFSHASPTALYRVDRGAGRQLGQGRRSLHACRRSWRRSVSQRRRSTSFELVARRRRREFARAVPARIRSRALGYGFDVPLLAGDHVTDDAGTGFVHTAPGHGREDFDLWMAIRSGCCASAASTRASPTRSTRTAPTPTDAPGFEGKRVITDKGETGRRQRGGHQGADRGRRAGRARQAEAPYPHSWRSKKPVIFRNTPQWFIAMDKPIDGDRPTLRETALTAIDDTRWVPASGENRIRGMVEAKPDWVMSRQRAWGVPIAMFVNKATQDILNDERVNARIADAFEEEGADAWYDAGAAKRFLAPDHDAADYEKIDDILDVWFDSGSTHSFVLGDARHFPGLAGIKRRVDGGADRGDVSRRLRPASRLVPVLAAGKLRHARPRALRRRADARLHPRREGSKDVEVARQPDLAAGRHQAVGRRHPAAVDGERRLFRRPAHRPGNPQKRQRQLSQAAQHPPLDARHAGPSAAAAPTSARRRRPSSSG